MTSMPRIAIVTPLCPTSAEPYVGNAISQTVSALRHCVDVEVFYAQAVFPRWRLFHPRKFLYSRADARHFPPGVPAKQIEYPAFPFVSRPFNGSNCARHLLPHLKKARPDVILAYWLYPEGYGAVLAGEEMGVPVILGARGSDLRAIAGPFSYRLVKSALRRASFVLTVSEELRQRAIAFGLPPERVRTILNGCDSSVFRLAERAAARAGLGLASQAQVVLFVGRLHPIKGLAELMEAAARLIPSHPRLEVVCIGEGPMERKCRARAAQADLAGHLRFLGTRTAPEVARWLAASNLLCLPSYSEGCPNVVLEALSCGRPVVASDVGGIPELVNPRCAILVPPRDLARLSQAISEALERRWDETVIVRHFRRSWEDVAQETYQVCCAALTRSTATFAEQRPPTQG